MGFDAKNGTAGGAGRRPGDAREGSGTSLRGGFRKSLKNSPESDARVGHDLSPLGTLGRPSDAFRASKWSHGCLFHMFYFDSILDSCFHRFFMDFWEVKEHDFTSFSNLLAFELFLRIVSFT